MSIRVPFLTNIQCPPHEESICRQNYSTLASTQRHLLQGLAEQCGVSSIELVSSGDLGVRVVAPSRSANAQAVSAVTCYLHYHRTGSLSQLIMLPLLDQQAIRAEAARVMRDLSSGGFEIKEGVEIPPASLYPLLLVAPTHLTVENAGIQINKAWMRLQSVLSSSPVESLKQQQQQQQELFYPQQQQQQQQQQAMTEVSPWGSSTMHPYGGWMNAQQEPSAVQQRGSFWVLESATEMMDITTTDFDDVSMSLGGDSMSDA